jgi:hypothetical protein
MQCNAMQFYLKQCKAIQSDSFQFDTPRKRFIADVVRLMRLPIVLQYFCNIFNWLGKCSQVFEESRPSVGYGNQQTFLSCMLTVLGRFPLARFEFEFLVLDFFRLRLPAVAFFGAIITLCF